MSLPLVTVGNPKKKKGRSHRKSGGKRRSNPKLGQKAKAAARKVGGPTFRGPSQTCCRRSSPRRLLRVRQVSHRWLAQ